jgi:hypothetical protein
LIFFYIESQRVIPDEFSASQTAPPISKQESEDDDGSDDDVFNTVSVPLEDDEPKASTKSEEHVTSEDTIPVVGTSSEDKTLEPSKAENVPSQDPQTKQAENKSEDDFPDVKSILPEKQEPAQDIVQLMDEKWEQGSTRRRLPMSRAKLQL